MVTVPVMLALIAWAVLAAFREHYAIKLFDCAYSQSNYRLLKKRWYLFGALTRALLTVLIACLWHGPTVDALLLMAYITVTWWIYFDATLNLLRGKPFFYVGQEAAVDRVLLRAAEQFRATPEWVAKLAKYGALILLLLTHILIEWLC